MMILSEDQLNNLNKEALIIIVSSLQNQLNSVHAQLDTANLPVAFLTWKILSSGVFYPFYLPR